VKFKKSLSWLLLHLGFTNEGIGGGGPVLLYFFEVLFLTSLTVGRD